MHKYVDLLMDDGCSVADLLRLDGPRPPAAPGVYVATVGMQPIYVGTTVKQTLWDRIGDMVACAIGLYDPDGEHAKGLHIGGRRINKKLPADVIMLLKIQWRANPPCIRCAEHELWRECEPVANKVQVKPCKGHTPALKLDRIED